MTQTTPLDAPASAPAAVPAIALAPREGAGGEAIRPFRARVPDAALADLRRRIAATRWPTRELVEDRSQGVQLATIQRLARY